MPAKVSTGRHAALVAAGIFLSRVAGLVRTRVFAHYFGLASIAADAFNSAFRIPNLLQNLFGEGVLSASFIPVYARLLAQKDEEEAGRLAGAAFAVLALVVSVVVLIGVVATPVLIDLIAAGFEGETRALTIQIVRILFPGAGLLVLSAWCLGILNSHRKFFLSYSAPVMWNLVMIGALVIYGRKETLPQLSITLAWASVIGSAVQFAIQLPMVLRLVSRLRFTTQSATIGEAVHNFVPVFFSRGVLQLSAYIDLWLASYLPLGSVTGLTSAQLIYTLPVSLFGMSITAAELPAMSSELGAESEVAAQLRRRLNSGLRRIAFFIVPSAAAFLALGDILVGALLQTGRFNAEDSRTVWAVLAGSAVGLLAQTLGRLYANVYYALRDTRTPLRFSLVRLFLTTALGWVAAFPLGFGVPGLTASAGISGWVEFALLRRSLNKRIGTTGLPFSVSARLWTAAAIGAAAAWGVKLVLPPLHPVVAAVPILGVYGGIYLGLAYAFRLSPSNP